VPITPTQEGWLTLEGGPQREIPADGVATYTVRVAVPEGAPAGRHSFRLAVANIENPEGDYVEGPPVSFEVPSASNGPPPPFPWWILVVALVLGTLGGIVSSLAIPGRPGPQGEQGIQGEKGDPGVCTEAECAMGIEVPVGAVIDWWRSNPGQEVPEGFMVADGSIVTDPESPFVNAKLPDLTNRFVLGVTDPGQIGSTGGSDTHSHAINHDHPAVNATTSNSGAHNHLWSRYVRGDRDWYTFDQNGNQFRPIDWSDGINNEGSGIYPLARDDAGSLNNWTDPRGAHNHTVSVDLANYSGNSGTSGHLPPYVGLLKIIRIK
jgi:hypothetical protein